MHGVRWLMFAAIIFLVRQEHQRFTARQRESGAAEITLDQVREWFPTAAGFAQTAPDSDSIIGYSGPSNSLIAWDEQQRILGIRLLTSGDTRDHVQAVREADGFLKEFRGLSRQEAQAVRDVDAVSGATLTSRAIAGGVLRRLGAAPTSSLFPQPLTAADARRLFSLADRIAPRADHPNMFTVFDSGGSELGQLARTSPHADAVMGYQGPTDTLLGFGLDGRVVGIRLRGSFDNNDYVDGVAEDDYFLSLFNGRTLEELAKIDLRAEQVEGVSGATMTSMSVARGLVKAADELRRPAAPPPDFGWQFAARDFGTLLIVILSLLIGFTRLRGWRWVRIPFQATVIGYLGFVNGDLLSLALLVGWSQNGVPIRLATGLSLLVAAALLCPLLTRRQIYCHHVCPHGAAQQWLKNAVPWKWHLPRWCVRGLSLLPAGLLAWAVFVAMRHVETNLASIEPFDAYIFRIAGWASIGLAIAGLVASLFVPMAYCRFGCPTGALLNFLRRHARSDRWSIADSFAAALLLFAFALHWASLRGF